MRRGQLLLAVLLPVLLGAGTASAQGGQEEARNQLEQIQGRWLGGPFLQPLRAAEPEAADAAWSAEWRAAVLAAVGRWDGPGLLLAGTLAEQLGSGAQVWGLSEGLELESRPVGGRLPAWLQEALRRQVAAQVLPARRLDNPLPQDDWMGAPLWTEPDKVQWDRPAVWAGPAVRDGVASYRSQGGQTRIRLAIGDPHALWQMARARGVAATLALDDEGQPLPWSARLPVRVQLQMPVWLVTPQELLPATLTAARTGDACEGGYTELRLAGERQPPVWAVLFLPDEAAGRAARVRRIGPPPEPEGQSPQAGAVSRLELSWPDFRLPTLHLVAKRFGDVWGSTVRHAEPPPDSQGALSAAGSPECAPR
jgi:hypothetical protein